MRVKRAILDGALADGVGLNYADGQMKILVVTNLYPPDHVGGYELGCQDVVLKLRTRGHEVHVLAGSQGGSGAAGNSEGVERTLRIEWGRHTASKREECRKLGDAVTKHQPDVIYFWNQAGLSYWLALYARWSLRRKTAFFLSDTNFVTWRVAAFLARRASGKGKFARMLNVVFARTILLGGYPIIGGQTCHFASRFLKEWAEKQGIRVAANSIIAHWGIEQRLFAAEPRERWPVGRLLYAGQIIPEKGVHTAISALGLLAQEPGMELLSLDIAGGCQYPDYEKKLRDLARTAGVAERVRFLGRVQREQIAAVYREHDVLVFPSEWLEPFAITPLEAITAGMAVAATNTGGSGELLRDGETAAVFEAGNAQACADAIRRLATNRELFEKVRANAAREVAAYHTLDGMVDLIEGSLVELAVG